MSKGMSKGPKSWNRNEVNKWWQTAIDKERNRLTNSPKSFKRNKFATPTNFSNFAPTLPDPRQPRSR